MTENIPACQGDKPSPSLSLALFSSSGPFSESDDLSPG